MPNVEIMSIFSSTSISCRNRSPNYSVLVYFLHRFQLFTKKKFLPTPSTLTLVAEKSLTRPAA
jgi:hypothetical protein